MKNRKIIIILLLLAFCILIIIKVGINGTTSSGIGMNLTNNGSIPNMLDSEHLSATNEDVVKEEVFQEIKKIYNTIDFFPSLIYSAGGFFYVRKEEKYRDFVI